MTPQQARDLYTVGQYRALSLPEVAGLVNEVLLLASSCKARAARIAALERQVSELGRDLKAETAYSSRLRQELHELSIKEDA